MSDLVRVRIKNGNKFRRKNMGRTLAEAADNVEILDDEPTHRGDGTPLGETTDSGRAVKPQTSVADEAAKKKPAAEPGDDTTTAEEKK